MNRREEYDNLIQELERPSDAVEHTLERAKKRLVRHRRVTRPIAGAVMTFVLFVVLVNFCAPVAYACSKVPVLKDLAEAVTFSRSLTDAVENEYMQEISLVQADGDVSATVEYLIVDQKQVNVFFRLYSDKYTNLGVEPEVRDATGERFAACSYGLNEWNVPNGELQSVTIDFINNNVPDSLQLKLKMRDMGLDVVTEELAPMNEEDIYFQDFEEQELDYVAEFDFLLEFDPNFTAAGKVIPIQQTVILDGQRITFTEMEVYPTHMRVNIEDVPDNTAWLRSIDFYIETDWGMKFEVPSNGITATGSADASKTMNSFRADSPYFYEAKHLTIVVTGAEWLRKDMEKVYVNLATGETDTLPEGITFQSAEQSKQGWLVKMQGNTREANHQHQLFMSNYFDAEGNEYYMNSWSSRFGDMDEEGNMYNFIEEYPLKNYPYDEVWLCPDYSHVWEAVEPVEIIVQ